MAFTPIQVRKLAGKLPERFVKTRTERGLTLSYVEGWHVIDEANRVFGFDGWDRETVSAECVWQDVRNRACCYAVRVRITVRAGKIIVSREGTGLGHGTGATLGEAHESALKEAETDATKRALITFGNLFGLALYDKDQAGVQRAKSIGAAPVAWTLLMGKAPPLVCETPQQFCSAAKEALRQAQTVTDLEALWTGNEPTISQLRAIRPELRTKRGMHFVDVLESLYREQHVRLEQIIEGAQALAAPTASVSQVEPVGSSATAKAESALSATRRIRDPEHLRYVAALPCLVCGRTPSHAHHLRYIQPRSLGSKASDEWAVPLCPIHHRSLHDAGREQEWWQAKGIDAKAEAERLWQMTHIAAANVASPIGHNEPQKSGAKPNHGGSADQEQGSPSKAAANQTPVEPPTDDHGQPVPINLHVDVSS